MTAAIAAMTPMAAGTASIDWSEPSRRKIQMPVATAGHGRISAATTSFHNWPVTLRKASGGISTRSLADTLLITRSFVTSGINRQQNSPQLQDRATPGGAAEDLCQRWNAAQGKALAA